MKSYLLWEGLPFLMLFGVFGILSIINWSYESKLVERQNYGSTWSVVYMGPIMMAGALGMTVAASIVLFIVRLTRPQSSGQWYMFVSLTITAIFLIFPSLSIIIMGPATISIIESMAQVPGH